MFYLVCLKENELKQGPLNLANLNAKLINAVLRLIVSILHRAGA